MKRIKQTYWLIKYWLFRHHLDVYVDKSGIGFDYKGEEVVWLWPWKRKSGGRFLGIDSFGVYEKLSEIDLFWEEYERADKK